MLVGVAVTPCVGTGVSVGVSTMMRVGVGEFIGVSVGVVPSGNVGVGVEEIIGVEVGVTTPVSVGVGDLVGVGVFPLGGLVGFVGGFPPPTENVWNSPFSPSNWTVWRMPKRIMSAMASAILAYAVFIPPGGTPVQPAEEHGPPVTVTGFTIFPLLSVKTHLPFTNFGGVV